MRPVRSAATTLTLLSLLTPLAGCGGDVAPGGDGWAGTTTDSAGVPVVRSPDVGLWGEDEGFRVVEELRVGSVEGPAEAQLGQVVSVDVDARGNLYVLDQQAREIRVFGPDGSFVRTVGEPGQGPGQLGMGVAGVFVRDGEILVPDLANARVTRFDPEGALLGSIPIDLTSGVPVRFEQSGTGPLFAQLRYVPFGADTAGFVASGDPIVRLGLGEGARDTLFTLPVGESVTFQGGQPRIRMFESEPIWDLTADGRLLTGRNSVYRIEVRDTITGSLLRVVEKEHERRPIDERHRDAFLEMMRNLMLDQGAPPQAVDGMLGQMEFADHYPVFATLAAGPEGTLWAQHIGTVQDLENTGGPSLQLTVQDLASPVFDVFDGEGRFLGEVAFPDRFQPFLVRGDRFYGVARDELDVQSVRVYRVERAGG